MNDLQQSKILLEKKIELTKGNIARKEKEYKKLRSEIEELDDIIINLNKELWADEFALEAVNKEISEIPTLAVQKTNPLFKTFAKGIAVLFLTLFSFSALCQYEPTSFALFGTQVGYSAKYHSAQGGFFGGYKFNNNYVGLNTIIPFTSKRSVPTATAGIEYSYAIGSVAPYVTGEYYSCGKEAVSEGEGTQGFDFGVGVAYYPESIPIKISVGLNGVDKLSQVKDFTNYLNFSIGGYITF